MSHLEEDLNDERSSADRLMERLDKTKEQVGLFLYCLHFIYLFICFFFVCLWHASHLAVTNIHAFLCPGPLSVIFHAQSPA